MLSEAGGNQESENGAQERWEEAEQRQELALVLTCRRSALAGLRLGLVAFLDTWEQ